MPIWLKFATTFDCSFPYLLNNFVDKSLLVYIFHNSSTIYWWINFFFSHFICLLLVELTSSNCFTSSSIFTFWLLIATLASIMGWFHSTIAMFIQTLGFEFFASILKYIMKASLPSITQTTQLTPLPKSCILVIIIPIVPILITIILLIIIMIITSLVLVIIIVIFPSLSSWSLNNLWNFLWLFDLN